MKKFEKDGWQDRPPAAFCGVKRLWGFSKVRYRGLAKNAARAFTALALPNLYLVRRPLMAQVRP
jgi:transposase, IS5 family